MNVTPDHSLGERIRQLRVERSWSQDDVARKIDVRALAVGKWERGQANPSTENRAKLAALFGVAPEELGVEIYAPTGTPPAWMDELVGKIDDTYVRVADVPMIKARVDLIALDIAAIKAHLGIPSESTVTS